VFGRAGRGILGARYWRRGRDSNPRPDKREAVFKTAALNHSATPPVGQYRPQQERDQREEGKWKGFGADERRSSGWSAPPISGGALTIVP
jgi:hypothetical protein